MKHHFDSVGFGQGAYGLSLSVSRSVWVCSKKSCGDMPEGTSADYMVLKNMNQRDPVVSVYGLYNASSQPVTDFKGALGSIDAWEMNYRGVLNPSLNQKFQYEYTTQSGQVYGVFYDSDHGSLGVRNLYSGETTVWTGNGKTGLSDIGVTDYQGL